MPIFQQENDLHRSISKLSAECHAAGSESDSERLQIENEIDQLSAKLWGLSAAELTAMSTTLASETESGELVDAEEENVPAVAPKAKSRE